MKQLYHKNKKMKQKICAINLNVIKKNQNLFWTLSSSMTNFIWIFFLFFNNDTHFQGVLLAICMQIYAAIFFRKKMCNLQ